MGDTICETWREIANFRSATPQKEQESLPVNDENIVMENNTLTDVKVVGRCTGVGVSTDDETVEYNVENYVAEVYDGQWYVGQVLKKLTMTTIKR